MPARVLDVGNCDPDHGAIRDMLERHFDVTVDRVMFVSEAEARLKSDRYDLVLVNRRIFADDSPGLDLVRWMKSGGASETPVMVVSNFDWAQAEAVAAGALHGFGKAGLSNPETIRRLERLLPRRAGTRTERAAG